MPESKRLHLLMVCFILLLSNPVLSQYSFYVRDHLGNTRAVLDEAGNTKAIYDYHPFGLTLRETVTGDTARYKFTGKELDDEGGLDWYYFGARYYDPSIGRWLSVDPILGKGAQAFLLANGLYGVSPYNYAFNRPTVLTDPDGECPQCVTAAVGGLIGGAIGGGLEFIKQANGGSLTDFGNFSLNRNFNGGKIAGEPWRV